MSWWARSFQDNSLHPWTTYIYYGPSLCTCKGFNGNGSHCFMKVKGLYKCSLCSIIVCTTCVFVLSKDVPKRKIFKIWHSNLLQRWMQQRTMLGLFSVILAKCKSSQCTSIFSKWHFNGQNEEGVELQSWTSTQHTRYHWSQCNWEFARCMSHILIIVEIISMLEVKAKRWIILSSTLGKNSVIKWWEVYFGQADIQQQSNSFVSRFRVKLE